MPNLDFINFLDRGTASFLQGLAMQREDQRYQQEQARQQALMAMEQQRLDSQLSTERLAREQGTFNLGEAQRNQARMQQPVQFNSPYADVLGPDFRAAGPSTQSGMSPVSTTVENLPLVQALLGDASANHQQQMEGDYRNRMLGFEQQRLGLEASNNNLNRQLNELKLAQGQREMSLSDALLHPSISTVSQQPEWASATYQNLLNNELEMAKVRAGASQFGSANPIDTLDASRQAMLQFLGMLQPSANLASPQDFAGLNTFINNRAAYTDPNTGRPLSEADLNDLISILSQRGVPDSYIPGFSAMSPASSSAVPNYSDPRQQAFSIGIMSKLAVQP